MNPLTKQKFKPLKNRNTRKTACFEKILFIGLYKSVTKNDVNQFAANAIEHALPRALDGKKSAKISHGTGPIPKESPTMNTHSPNIATHGGA